MAIDRKNGELCSAGRMKGLSSLVSLSSAGVKKSRFRDGDANATCCPSS